MRGIDRVDVACAVLIVIMLAIYVFYVVMPQQPHVTKFELHSVPSAINLDQDFVVTAIDYKTHSMYAAFTTPAGAMAGLSATNRDEERLIDSLKVGDKIRTRGDLKGEWYKVGDA